MSPFPNVFSPFLKNFLPFSSNLKLSSQTLSVWKSVKFVLWERVKGNFDRVENIMGNGENARIEPAFSPFHTILLKNLFSWGLLKLKTSW